MSISDGSWRHMTDRNLENEIELIVRWGEWKNWSLMFFIINFFPPKQEKKSENVFLKLSVRWLNLKIEELKSNLLDFMTFKFAAVLSGYALSTSQRKHETRNTSADGEDQTCTPKFLPPTLWGRTQRRSSVLRIERPRNKIWSTYFILSSVLQQNRTMPSGGTCMAWTMDTKMKKKKTRELDIFSLSIQRITVSISFESAADPGKY